MLDGRIFGTVNNKLVAVVTLLAIVGFAFMAQSAGAKTGLDCDPGGGGSGDTIAPTVTSISPAKDGHVRAMVAR